MSYADVNINVLSTDDAAVAEVSVWVGSRAAASAVASSKRHPEDDPDQDAGASIALARALREVADDMEKAARADIARAY
jgi:hypothetical protein